MNAPREKFAEQARQGCAPEAASVAVKTGPGLAPLRIMTAGSVDDGKSTLIGRLMYDLNLMTDDVLDDLRAASRRNGRGELDLSLFTDGLIAEREQGITIDVAYRYFRHQDRPFILCDSPGHEQYTRNMVCAASQADIALIMIDARQGPTRQSLRHLRIAQWLRVPAIVFAINKMDLAGFSQQRYAEIVEGLKRLLGTPADKTQSHFEFVPVVAVDGDHVVHRVDDPARLGWYKGPTLLEVIEHTATQASFLKEAPLRFTVQMVLRPTGREAGELHDFRGLAGRVESGQVLLGKEVLATSAEGITRTSRIAGIHQLMQDGMANLQEAHAGESVVLTLADDLDITRGDTLSEPEGAPSVTRSLAAQLCWMSENPARPGQRILVKQGTRTAVAKIEAIEEKLSLEVGRFEAVSAEEAAAGLKLNEVATIRITLAQSLLEDRYSDLPRTGSLLVLEPNSFDTLAAGIVI